MKIIHCSDMHLDSALGSNFSPEKARERNAELRATFARLLHVACEEQVDAVLIAGDLFDSSYVSSHTMSFAIEQIRKAKNVTFFYLRGNHDASRNPFDAVQLPDNLKTFDAAWKSYPCGDVVITGMEADESNIEAGCQSLQLQEDCVNIVLLHGQISTQAGPDLVPLPMLRNKHIDYLALGHIHSYQMGKLDHRGSYCYCGCPEGRGFDECGEKGFVLLEIKNGRVQWRFIPFAARTLHEVKVDISNTETVTGILTAMKQAAQHIPSKDLVKFVLTGTHMLQTQKDIHFLQKMLEYDFWYVKIKDESELRIDRKSYEYDVSLKGEFVRSVLASDYSEAEKKKIIAYGIRALNGEEVVL